MAHIPPGVALANIHCCNSLRPRWLRSDGQIPMEPRRTLKRLRQDTPRQRRP